MQIKIDAPKGKDTVINCNEKENDEDETIQGSFKPLSEVLSP